MIIEMATIDVAPGTEAAFEHAVGQARPLFLAARGCRGLELHQGVEAPSQYVLIVRWDTLEDHTVHFRESEAFAQWRALVGPHFAAPPQVRHTQVVLTAG